MRFENHTCEWSLFDVPFIEKDPSAIRPEGATLGFDEDFDEFNQHKTTSDDYLYSY